MRIQASRLNSALFPKKMATAFQTVAAKGLTPDTDEWSVERLWRQYHTNLTKWWDDRSKKVISQSPDLGGGSFDFMAALKLCKDLDAGRGIHAGMMETGGEFSVHVMNSLMDMYVRCGSMVDAHYVFDNMPMHSVASWSVVILGYAKKEEGGLALKLYRRMQQKGFMPNDRTFVGALKACSSLAGLEEGAEMDGKVVKVQSLARGRAIHCRVAEMGLESNLYVGTMLVDMYAKCGSMVDAQRVFDKLPCRSVVSWNAMIRGYAQNDEGKVALELYAQMQQDCVVPDDWTFVGVLKACSSLATSEAETGIDGMARKMGYMVKGRAIHSQVVKRRLESNVYVGTMLVDMYAKCGSMEDARHVFDMLPHRDVVSWTAMILGYAQADQGEVALELYAQMQAQGIRPDSWAFIGALKACSSLASHEKGTGIDEKVVKVRALAKGRAIHTRVVECGFEANVFMGAMLVDVYAKCGSMVDARCVFDKLSHRNTVCWNALIQGYAEETDSTEVFKLYGEMQKRGLSPDSMTFLNLLKVCGNTADLEAGSKIHMQLCQLGHDESTDVIVGTALVDMYGKCGSMFNARRVFDALRTRDVVTWSALIAGYARQGESELVFHLFARMRQEGIQPNGITFLMLLTVCSHAGLVAKGHKYFDDMSERYGIAPTIEHYGCMIDMLCRAGQLEEAMAMVKAVPFQHDLAIWTTMLGACRKWMNVEIGMHAFERAVSVDKRNAAAYLLMSNIYADAHMYEEREKIQAMRETAQAWKKPGKTWWTEFDGMVHTFMVGDTKHPKSDDIYVALNDLFCKIQEEGYVPNPD